MIADVPTACHMGRAQTDLHRTLCKTHTSRGVLYCWSLPCTYSYHVSFPQEAVATLTETQVEALSHMSSASRLFCSSLCNAEHRSRPLTAGRRGWCKKSASTLKFLKSMPVRRPRAYQKNTQKIQSRLWVHSSVSRGSERSCTVLWRLGQGPD